MVRPRDLATVILLNLHVISIDVHIIEWRRKLSVTYLTWQSECSALLDLYRSDVQKAALGPKVLADLSPSAARIFHSWVHKEEQVGEAMKKFVKELSKSRKK
ncbi:hypothetical protein M407DRAFT_28463 [Tulasnella calospora MUT 4182]|uniref:Uncharacterized protein n=1 Tax=Tulasnella calospora MUT 4182 TaxID=1051891 RepID=A0A0C3LKU0_9AGAM|nr:hypothetical protein M407DRAFT_28463 [Tulasnella calospora MUT 4182]